MKMHLLAVMTLLHVGVSLGQFVSYTITDTVGAVTNVVRYHDEEGQKTSFIFQPEAVAVDGQAALVIAVSKIATDYYASRHTLRDDGPSANTPMLFAKTLFDHYEKTFTPDTKNQPTHVLAGLASRYLARHEAYIQQQKQGS